MNEKMFLLLILLIPTFYQVQSATINFDVSLATPNLGLECTYTLEKNEELYRVILKKDSETFVSFDNSNKDKPEFTQVEGITDVTLHGAGKVTINNYEDTTWGIYSCNVYYDLKDKKKSNSKSKSKEKELKGTQSVSKKLRLKKNTSTKCTASWKDGFSNGEYPSDAWVPGGDGLGNDLRFCRVNYKGDLLPGYITSSGCRFTYKTDAITESKYQVLIAPNSMSLVVLPDNSNKEVPADSWRAGKDASGTYYIGACKINGISYLGKIGHWQFTTAYEEGEYSSCSDTHIFTCSS